MFNSVYKNTPVFVTGHSGFNGSWLCLWLKHMDARVNGFSLPPPTNPNHYDLLKLDINSTFGDIRNYQKLSAELDRCKPEIVFHLAAQPSVLYSYKNPIETFETNIIGTANVIEACRNVSSIKAVVVITTDKCYENREQSSGYTELDRLGGDDPYSASKACAELVAASYRKSFFETNTCQASDRLAICTARGGNVIGGGDWTNDRLVPDVMRNTAIGRPVEIRNPSHIRPWQHVLDLLSGYLLLGQTLLEGKRGNVGPWNFGPATTDQQDVQAVTDILKSIWPKITYTRSSETHRSRETTTLKLNSNKARELLKWIPVWPSLAMFEKTVEWYQHFYDSQTIISEQQLINYIDDAKDLADWATT
jgi:CDP-glucose 4,6-dehydratase